MNDIHDMEKLEKARSALDALLALTGAIAEDMRAGLEERGLTRTRAHLLWVLGEAGEVTQRVLADRLGVTPRNVTALLDALEFGGHIARRPHPTDRRASVVTLTPAGRAAVARLRQERDLFANALFEDFAAADLDALARMLGTLHGRLAEIAGAGAQDPGHAG